ncbi:MULTISPECIES: hypothetical protein [unclassified Lactococcus]|uniref:hypothetical protein n=1 Tax=unclassified Lactococcus TaxID=2643510 RepID=UPI0011C884C6|nr:MULTISPECIES: hypothetical protein [unclassified Lactococcus]MQW23416.1 hypothetical protein [Lactococcus sp. dk101]TXK37072.1 hypothetical protein FVP42_10120 [Lactococcus sp. dk310]TXK37304.1 hypothetical protein FVP42_09350 [Lactococcus sp. dk310]TXK47700.1 hypothetical protein FVP43_09735 [Lactococcus sp. dk322]
MEKEKIIPHLVSVMKTEMMFNLTILFHNNPEYILLKFKDEAQAKETLEQINQAKYFQEVISIWDDRNKATIDGSQVSTISIEEVGA